MGSVVMIKKLKKNYKIFLISATLLLSLFSISASALYQETVLSKYDEVHSLITGNYAMENTSWKNIIFSNGYEVDHRTYSNTTTALDVIKAQSRTTITIYYRTW